MSTVPASPGSLTTGNRIDQKLVRGRVRYERTDAPGVGTVFFSRSGGVLRDLQEHEFLVPETVGPLALSDMTPGQPNTGGEFAVMLPVNDDPQVQPRDTQWTATFNIAGASGGQFPPVVFTLSVNDPATVWLDVKVTAAPVGPTLSFVLSGDPRLLPSGGALDQVLRKKSNADYDVEWAAGPTAGGPGTTAALTTFDNAAAAAIAQGISANNVQLALVEVAAERATHAQTFRVVNTGGDVDFARPTGVGAVAWIHSGTTRPNQYVPGTDYWAGQVPPNGSITDAMVSATANIGESKLSLASNAPAAQASRRSTDGSPGSAAPYSHPHPAMALFLSSVGYVDAGADPDTPRPTLGYPMYIWDCLLEPNFMDPNKDWWNDPEGNAPFEDFIASFGAGNPFPAGVGIPVPVHGSDLIWSQTLNRWIPSTFGNPTGTTSEEIASFNALAGREWKFRDTRRQTDFLTSVMPSGTTWSAMPNSPTTGPTDLLGSTMFWKRMDLASVGSARVYARVLTAATGSGAIRAQYSRNNGVNWQYLDGAWSTGSNHAGTGPTCSVTAVGAQPTAGGGFLGIHTDARADVLVRLVGTLGNGSSPVFGAVGLETR